MYNNFLWWRDGVIYQIYVRSFADSNGDGIGDLKGIIDHLDYLNGMTDSLGIDAIWLTPINPSPGYDFGYDVSDYENIDPVFGSMNDFELLIKEAHKRNIRVIMDFVFNHTSHLHPWFIESSRSKDNPKRNWYLWGDAKPNGDPPNNWQACFGGNAWQWDDTTKQFYYHMFLKEQPDLNWRNEEVRKEIFRIIKKWLELGVDGLRLDVVNGFFKDELLRDNPPANGERPFDQQLHIYDRDRPELIPVITELRSLLDSFPERMAVGEVIGENPNITAKYFGDGSQLLNLAFNFDLIKQHWDAKKMLCSILNWESALHTKAFPCYFLSNHDFHRHATRFGAGVNSDAKSKVAAAMLLTLRGTPFLYYGEELGMQDTVIPKEEIQDPFGKNYTQLGRDPERNPMQWNDSANAGFTTAVPWLRANDDYKIRNVILQQKDENSVLNFYKKLIKLRKESVTLQKGRLVIINHSSDDVLIYLRQYEDEAFLIGLNFSDKQQYIEYDNPAKSKCWRKMLSSISDGHFTQGNKIILEPFEAYIGQAELDD
ncbi:MAG: alpha-amylase family glycosyl hydrolase [Ignavibacteria bacterium]